MVTTLKTDKDYLIGVPVIVETDCLPLLGMIVKCSTPDVTMLRWISYIKSLGPELMHISGKNNQVADILSRARYMDVEDMQSDYDNVGVDYFIMSSSHEKNHCFCFAAFHESEYCDEMLLLGRYLSSLQKPDNCSNE